MAASLARTPVLDDVMLATKASTDICILSMGHGQAGTVRRQKAVNVCCNAGRREHTIPSWARGQEPPCQGSAGMPEVATRFLVVGTLQR
jgi:hypothetical protein